MESVRGEYSVRRTVRERCVRHVRVLRAGSSFKREASSKELQKPLPTLKDNDLTRLHARGFTLEPEAYTALLNTLRRDTLVRGPPAPRFSLLFLAPRSAAPFPHHS